jgi:hypothetical protein
MNLLYRMCKTRKKDHENKEKCIRKFDEGGEAFANIECAFNANIIINNSGVLYNTKIISEIFFIPTENIKKVQVKTDEELTKQIVDNKIPLIGGLTFARKIHLFLILNYTENNLELEKIIESKMAEDGATAILKARQQYNENHPKLLLEEIDTRLPNDNFESMDIPNQINKLFELVEKGALSLEEFNQKKKELLLKM